MLVMSAENAAAAISCVQDVIDLRAHRWVARRKVEGPKKIDDIHKDARAELQRQRMAPLPDRRDRRGPPERGPPLPLCVSAHPMRYSLYLLLDIFVGETRPNVALQSFLGLSCNVPPNWTLLPAHALCTCLSDMPLTTTLPLSCPMPNAADGAPRPRFNKQAGACACRRPPERRVDDRVDAPIRPMNRAPSQEWLMGSANTGGLRPGGGARGSGGGAEPTVSLRPGGPGAAGAGAGVRSGSGSASSLRCYDVPCMLRASAHLPCVRLRSEGFVFF